jgi:nickel-dependent lactate racemase
VIDEDRRLSFVNFGAIVESHLEAVAFMRRYAEVSVPRRFKTVVTSAAGYPLDKTYYQTVKGMVGPLDILEPGGDLIIASECSEGLGSKHFRDAQQRLVRLGPDRFMAELRGKSHAAIDEWQTQMQLKPMRVGRIQLYSDLLSDEDKVLTGVDCIDSVERAIGASVARHGDPDIALVPEGPYVVPLYGGS